MYRSGSSRWPPRFQVDGVGHRLFRSRARAPALSKPKLLVQVRQARRAKEMHDARLGFAQPGNILLRWRADEDSIRSTSLMCNERDGLADKLRSPGGRDGNADPELSSSRSEFA